MTTRITVSSATNGTLKTNHQQKGKFRIFWAVAALVLVSLATLASETDDTTRHQTKSEATDNCCFNHSANRQQLTSLNSYSDKGKFTIHTHEEHIEPIEMQAKVLSFLRNSKPELARADAQIDSYYKRLEAEIRLRANFKRMMEADANIADPLIDTYIHEKYSEAAANEHLDKIATNEAIRIRDNKKRNQQFQLMPPRNKKVPAMDKETDLLIRTRILHIADSTELIEADRKMDIIFHDAVFLKPQRILEADRLLDVHIIQQ